MSVIRWENPVDPERRGGPQSKWTVVIAELRQRPQRWALIRQGPRGAQASMATRINQGENGWGAGFEAKCRKDGDTYNLYARYVGGEAA